MIKKEQIKSWLQSFHKRVLDSKLCELIYAEEMTAIIDALDLIDEQAAEIKRLKEENEFLDRTDEERYQEAEDNIRAEIANGGTSCHWCEDIIRKKAVNEFAEKLKETIFDYLGVKTIEEANELSLINSTLTYDVVTDRIDELLKEHEK